MELDISSFVTVRHARYRYDLVPRRTELDGIDRWIYGDPIPASNAAAALNFVDLLKCSDCQSNKHFEQFPKSSVFLHRHGGRGYQCNECQQKRRDEAKAALLNQKMDAKWQAKQGKKSKKQRRKSK